MSTMGGEVNSSVPPLPVSARLAVDVTWGGHACPGVILYVNTHDVLIQVFSENGPRSAWFDRANHQTPFPTNSSFTYRE